jgi:hypothetical protein
MNRSGTGREGGATVVLDGLSGVSSFMEKEIERDQIYQSIANRPTSRIGPTEFPWKTKPNGDAHGMRSTIRCNLK